MRERIEPITYRVHLALIFLATSVLFGCSERGEIDFAKPDASATTHKIWVSNFRSTAPATARSAPPRPENLSFEAIGISVPPSHTPGQIEWPDGTPDARTDFVSVSQEKFDTMREFTNDIVNSDQAGRGETLVYVHGYNTRHAEAVYQVAQFVHDLDVPVPPVLFSWPSAGVTAGYVYDRDSALLSRDELEAVLVSLTRDGRKVVLVGHSLGSYLIMETLRQIELKNSLNIARDIDAVVLMAPDIDGELFRDQATALNALPDPFIIMVAKQDRALKISSLLTGRRPRLGAQTDRTIVGDLPITIVDLSDLAEGAEFNHKIATTSPAAVSILRELSKEVPPGQVRLGPFVILSQLAL